MSMIERGGEEAENVLDALFPKVGRAYRIGITGLTGAGKSSLINRLSRIRRDKGERVGVIAVDPTSPFSGGALLGDRIRMGEVSGDEGVFIRSIASRGSDSGLSSCADELADVLDAFGSDVIFLETVGIGQQEYRIGFSVHTTVVVLVPEAGDDIQSLKSGLMEIGDVFVVNKADRENASRYADDLRAMLKLRHSSNGWCPLVVSTSAVKGEGVEELDRALLDHRSFLDREGGIAEKKRSFIRNRISMIVEERLRENFWGNAYIERKMDELIDESMNGKRSPYEAAKILLAAFMDGKIGE